MRRVATMAALLACANDAPPQLPSRVAESADFPLALAVDGDDLVWTTQSGDLFSAPKSGGAASLVAHVVDDEAWALAVAPSSFYIGSPFNGLVAIDRASLASTSLDTGCVAAVATDVIGDVHWAAASLTQPSTNPGIKRLRIGDASSTELLSSEQSSVVAVDYVGVYWIDGANDGWGCTLGADPCRNAQGPVRARFADGTSATYAAATPSTGSLAADGSALYVGDWCAGTVTKIDHASGASTVIASGLEWPGAILVDGDAVWALLISRCTGGFWGGSTGGGSIARIAKDGSAVTRSAIAGRWANAITMDETALYYVATDASSGDAGSTHQTIFAIAKSAF